MAPDLPFSPEIPFRIEIPIEVWHKAGDPGKERRIGGVISTEHEDKQGEIVLQRGLDFSDFIKNGWLNDNHSRDTAGVVGYPLRVERTTVDGKPATRMEGYLLEGTKQADKIWELAQALQTTDRRLGWSIEGKVLRRSGPDGKQIAGARVTNVAITNCFPGDVEVFGAAEGISRRFYSGPMIEIHLATGEKLTGTPNHPIFTQRGWVALCDLVEGQDRIGRRLGDLVMAPGAALSDDVQDVPAKIEELYDLALLLSTTHRVCPALEANFHGDGRGGDVDVVSVHGSLQDRLEAAFAQKFGEDALAATDKELAQFTGIGASSDHAIGVLHAPSRGMGVGGELHSLGGSPGGVAPELFFVPTPGQAPAACDVVDGFAGDPVSGSDAGRALSQAIGFSDLVGKRSLEWSGHVFDLQCRHGWFEANGIIAHNCPVNTKTGLDVLAKSLMAVEKMMEAGSAITPPSTPTPGDGFALRTESLEGVSSPSRPKKKKRRRRLTKAEAMRVITDRFPGIHRGAAEKIWLFASRKGA